MGVEAPKGTGLLETAGQGGAGAVQREGEENERGVREMGAGSAGAGSGGRGREGEEDKVGYWGLTAQRLAALPVGSSADARERDGLEEGTGARRQVRGALAWEVLAPRD